MISATVEAPKITEQIRKLDDFGKIAQAEYTKTMRDALSLGVADIIPRTPTDSGTLRASVGSAIKFTAGENVRGIFTAKAISPASAKYPQGFPYGYALDSSSKYRSGGRKTKGWLRGVVRRKRTAIIALFSDATARIIKRLEVN